MLLGYSGVPLPKGIGNYVTDDGVIRDDNGNPVVAMEEGGILTSSTVFDPHCDPNAAYPVGSVCWGIQQGIDAKAILQTMTGTGTPAAKPCLGTPIVKGISNCTLAIGAAAFALFLFAQNR